MNVFRELRTPGRRYRRLPSADMEEDVSDVQTKHENNESLASPVDTVASLDMSFKRMLEQEPRCAREPAVNLMNDYVIVESRTSHADPVFKVVDSDIPHDSFTDNRPISPLSPSISSDDDDDVWTVSVEAPKPTSGTSVLPRSSTKTNRRLHRAKQNRTVLKGASVAEAYTPELAASQAALHAERKRREKLEESLIRLRKRTPRIGSTSSEPGSLGDIISPHDILVAYSEELNRRLSLQLDLEGKDYLIEKMRKNHATDDSAPVEGWLEVSRSLGIHAFWREEYVALSSRRLLFFRSSEDFVRQRPCRVIQLDKVITVRNFESETNGTLNMLRTYSNDQRVIQVAYAAEGETKVLHGLCDGRDTEKLLRGFVARRQSGDVSKILYIKAKTCREKQQWLKRLKARLVNCPYTGNAGMAGSMLLQCLHNLTEYSDADVMLT